MSGVKKKEVLVQSAAVVPPRVIYIHNEVLSCVETAGMGSSAGHESSSQCKTIKTEALINKQSGFGHVTFEDLLRGLESSRIQ